MNSVRFSLVVAASLGGALASTACYYVRDPPPAQPAPPPPAAPPPVVAAPPPPPPPLPVAERLTYRRARQLGEADRQALLRGTWRRRPAAGQGGQVAATAPGSPAGAASPGPAAPSGAPTSAPPAAVGPGALPPPPLPTLPAVPVPDAGAAAACLDANTGTVPACALQPVDPSCKATSTAAARCQGLGALLTPKVAASAVACMNKLSGKDLCDPVKVAACASESLARSCPDTATVAPLCQIAEGPCKVPEAQCVSMMSGLTEKAQDMVAQCIAQGCGAGLEACVAGLKTP